MTLETSEYDKNRLESTLEEFKERYFQGCIVHHLMTLINNKNYSPAYEILYLVADNWIENFYKSNMILSYGI